jgi:flagellar biosynthesis/type III secretory pathway protein FliH
MRFGAALDLWAKSDLREAQTEHPKTAEDDGYVSDRPPAPARLEQPAPARAEQGEKRQETREEAFARLTEQYRNCWGNALALGQIRLEGKNLGFSKERVQGPPPESKWMTFDELLEARVNELNAPQGAERSAA